MTIKSKSAQLLCLAAILALYGIMLIYAAHVAIPRSHLGFHAEFFNSRYLQGEPAESWEDREIDFNDHSRSEMFRGNNFGVTWRGYLPIRETNTYVFNLLSDDGARLTIDGEVVIDHWYDHPITEVTEEVKLTAGWHEIFVEWYEKTGSCAIRVTMGPPQGKQRILGRAVSISAPEDRSAESAAKWLRKLWISNLSRRAITPLFLLSLLFGALVLLNAMVRLPQSGDGANLNYLVIIFILSFTAFFLPSIYSIGYHNFVYIRSIVADLDLNFVNDYKLKSELIDRPPVDPYEWYMTENLAIPNPEGIGPALLWSPSFFVGHLIARWLMVIKLATVADGATMVEVSTMLFGSTAFGFFALILIYFTLRLGFKSNTSLLAVLSLWFGMFSFFMFKASCFSQTTQTFMAALFLFFWLKDLGARTKRGWIHLGLIAGLMLWTGFLCAPYLLLPLAEWYWSLRKEKLPGSTGHFVIFTMITVVAAGVQLIITGFINHGIAPLTISQYHVPGLRAILFGIGDGLLVWYPVSILSILGLFRITRTNHRVVDIFLAATFLLSLILAGYSQVIKSPFGAQNLIPTLPLLALGLASFIDRFGRRSVIGGFLWLSAVFHLFVFAAYERGQLDPVLPSYPDFLRTLMKLTPLQVLESWKYSQFVNAISLLLKDDRYAELLTTHAFLALLIMIGVIGTGLIMRWFVLPRLNRYVQ